MRRKIAFCVLFFGLGGASQKAGAIDESFFGRDSLWTIVHDVCASVNWLTGVAAPCLAVDRDRGFATLRPWREKTRIIVTPLSRVSGVESVALQEVDKPNYWLDAWSQRDWVAKAAPRPLGWSEMGMAINSPQCRSQDQLHIHVDCLDPRLQQKLTDAAPGQDGWFNLDLHPWARVYRARRLRAGDLDRNIFRMVARDVAGGKDELAAETLAAVMAEETIAVVGTQEANGERGFVILAAGGGGCAEELLDRQCRLALSGRGDLQRTLP